MLRCLILMWIVAHTSMLVQGDDVADPNFFPRLVGDYIPQNCWNFSYGDYRSREFYSPRYPQNYLNNTSCIQQLIAPRGFRIRLDFRDDFYIEVSDSCKYDYLELRDGPYGYSPLIGRYCGRQHPPMIESSSRHLWIRFQSDDSIEYKGFRAVYDFFVPGVQEEETASSATDCNIRVDVSKHDGYISSADVANATIEAAKNNSLPLDCTWVIYSPSGHRTWIVWQSFRISGPESCSESFIEMYDRTTSIDDRRSLYCGNSNRNVRSHTNLLYLRAYALDAEYFPEFKALFTLYTTGTCLADRFECEENVCINSTLVCNKRENCRPGRDEASCKGPAGGGDGVQEVEEQQVEEETTVEPPLLTERHLTILGVVSGCLIVVVAIAIFITCKQHKSEMKRRKHALKQEDRRNTIELTNLLNQHESPARTRQSGASGTQSERLHRSSSTERQPRQQHAHVGNHVTGAARDAGATAASSQPNHSKHNGYATGHSHAYGHGTTATGGEAIPSGSGSSNYLDVNRRNLDVDNSSPSKSRHRIPAVVTIEPPYGGGGVGGGGEHGAGGAGGGGGGSIPSRSYSSERLYRTKEHSPRPDIVQETDFNYPSQSGAVGGPLKRDLSGEFTNVDANDSWKYLSDVTTVVPQSRSIDDWCSTVPRTSVKSSKSKDSCIKSSENIDRVPYTKSSTKNRRSLDGETYTRVSGQSLDEQGTYYQEPAYELARQSSMKNRTGISPEKLTRSKQPASKHSPPRRQRSIDDVIYVSPGNNPRFDRESWRQRSRQSEASAASDYSPDQFYTRPPNRSAWQHHPV